MKKGSKRFFFGVICAARRKKQKTFAPLGLGHCTCNAPGLDSQKFFAPLFFKKAATCFV
jgi:hypothetical protein